METSSVTTYRYSGRIITIDEIDWIRAYIAANPKLNRAELSRLVGQHLKWFDPYGRLKEMSCRIAMLRMHRDGLIELPAPKGKNGNGRRCPRTFSATSAAGQSILDPVSRLTPLIMRQARAGQDTCLWNELIQRYHYLGHSPLTGAQIKYLIYSTGGSLLAVLGFAAAAWKVASRDQFIQWSDEQRLRNLHLVVNNARFLILPWVTSKNLASHILGLAARQLPLDWQARYNYQPVLMETFVQKDRFKGTCYRAANWMIVGQTQGRGKRDRFNEYALPVKDVFVYPLNKSFRNILCSTA
jgi:hypothetical protein